MTRKFQLFLQFPLKLAVIVLLLYLVHKPHLLLASKHTLIFRQEIKNMSMERIEFFIFTFSFFLTAVNRLISLYLEMVNVLNKITAKYITAK